MSAENPSRYVVWRSGFATVPGLFGRIVRKLVRIAGHAAHALVVLPQVLAPNKINKSIEIKYLFNTLVVIDATTVHKAACFGGRTTLQLEYDNCSKIGTEFSALKLFLPPVELLHGVMFSELCMPRYRPLSCEDAAPHAILMHRHFRALGIRQHFEDFCRSPEYMAGAAILHRICTVREIEKLDRTVRCYINEGLYHLGPAHGDFHSRNMMLDGQSSPKLIDWDCVRFRGVQEFDALYFILEREWSLSGRLWYETLSAYAYQGPDDQAVALMKAFDISFGPEMAVTFFVDRIGQEAGKFDFHYPEECLRLALKKLLHPIN